VLIDCHLNVFSLFLVQRPQALSFSFDRICKLYFVTYVVKYILKKTCPVRGRADKSLTRSTSRCRSTESIESLKEWSIHVPNFKVFRVTEAEIRLLGSLDYLCNQFDFCWNETAKEFLCCSEVILPSQVRFRKLAT
jgi:hypothetical protein